MRGDVYRGYGIRVERVSDAMVSLIFADYDSLREWYRKTDLLDGVRSGEAHGCVYFVGFDTKEDADEFLVNLEAEQTR
jgi:hypothetical protein